MKGGDEFAHLGFGKWCKHRTAAWKTLITASLCFLFYVATLPTSAAVLCDTVCDNTNTSFCHCTALTGSLERLVIQLKQPAPEKPWHISIMLLTKRRDTTRLELCAHTCAICMSITFENSRREATKANLKLHCSKATMFKHGITAETAKHFGRDRK